MVYQLTPKLTVHEALDTLIVKKKGRLSFLFSAGPGLRTVFGFGPPAIHGHVADSYQTINAAFGNTLQIENQEIVDSLLALVSSISSIRTLEVGTLSRLNRKTPRLQRAGPAGRTELNGGVGVLENRCVNTY